MGRWVCPGLWVADWGLGVRGCRQRRWPTETGCRCVEGAMNRAPTGGSGEGCDGCTPGGRGGIGGWLATEQDAGERVEAAAEGGSVVRSMRRGAVEAGRLQFVCKVFRRFA